LTTYVRQLGYWTRKISRRRAIAVTGSTALGAAFLTACGGGSSDSGSSGGSTTTKQTGPLGQAATQGKRGGKLVWQSYGDPGGGLELMKIRNQGVHQMAGLTHDGLLEFKNGTPEVPGDDQSVQPNLAAAFPEQAPDKVTYTFKLRPAKFHNGRAVTSEDVKYSFDRYANGADSAWKADWAWYDKAETPDAQTVVIKAKFPYADLQASLAQYRGNVILAKEHEESAEHEKKLMGSGPFTFVDYSAPNSASYKRNPEYHRQPFPYFDEVLRIGARDDEKMIADFSAKNTHVTYWLDPEATTRLKKARPDAQIWSYVSRGSNTFYVRTDKAPFNDERVRQALSMAINRKAYVDAINAGEGEPDQALSWSGSYYNFRKPKDLGAAAKFWNFDVAEAKKLLAASGASLPLKFELPHWDPTVIGQKFVDGVTLIEAQWKQSGIADVTDKNLTFGQAASTVSIGNYDTIYWGPNTTSSNPDVGFQVRNKYYSPPEGIKAAPTLNLGWINDRQLSDLAEKQLGILDRNERISVFHAMEDILAAKMYHIVSATNVTAYFGDPSLKNAQMSADSYNGALPWMKYWWFDKA